MEKIEYHPIGIIHTPFKKPSGTPIQPPSAEGVSGEVELFEQYVEGLQDLAGFSHIYLVYHFHLVKSFKLRIKPFLDDQERGLFATRAPARPNPIGLSVVKLTAIHRHKLLVRDIDIIDQTPLLDIKPFVPEFDARKADRLGWIAKRSKKLRHATDDGRFSH
jgi:tRNA-Thr(GGU) m(6)t(6)A37 methyltransferase TsaA